MKQIKELLFGKRREPVCDIKLGFKTTHPQQRPDEWAWAQEFRVGMLADRKLVYLN